MTTRDLYARLIRCHPLRFRQQFEAEMLATFDDASRERDSLSLLLDAMVSLIRQWVFRPDNWNVQRHAPAGGGMVMLEQLRRQSVELHRRAWRMNLAVLIASLIVVVSLPSSGLPSRGNAVNALILVLFIVVAYRRHKNGLATIHQEYLAVSITADRHRSELVRKRDSLRIWAGGGSLSWPWAEGGPVLVMFLIVILRLAMFLLLWVHTGTRPWSTQPILFAISTAGTGAMWIFWYFARKCDLLAAAAIQREIDAIDRAGA
jgi:hypothetical protein